MKNSPAVGRIVLIAVLAISFGCTQVRVQRVDAFGDGAAGIRYSLPKPYLELRTGEDGRITASFQYLPDPERTYAIDAFSYLTTHRMDVTVANGLLTKVDWQANSAAIPETGAELAANLAVERLNASKAAQTASAEEIAAAQEAVEAARLEVQLARAELTEAQRSGDAAVISAARLALRKAEIRLAAARRRLQRASGAVQPLARGTVAPSEDTSEPAEPAPPREGGDAVRPQSDNMPPNAEEGASRPKVVTVWGPIVYALHERLKRDGEHVEHVLKLASVPFQPAGEANTYTQLGITPKPAAAEPDTSAPVFEFHPSGFVTVIPQNGRSELAIDTSLPVILEDVTAEVEPQAGGPLQAAPVAVLDPNHLVISLDGLQPGDYRIRVPVRIGSDGPQAEVDLFVRLLRPGP